MGSFYTSTRKLNTGNVILSSSSNYAAFLRAKTLKQLTCLSFQAIRFVIGYGYEQFANDPCYPRTWQDVDDMVFEIDLGDFHPSYRPSYSSAPSSQPSPEEEKIQPSLCTVKRIKVQSTTTLPIHIFELRAISDGINLALGGNTRQSSTYNNDGLKFGAANAADGNEATFSSTMDGEAQWWEVNLEVAANIQSIQILNRFCGQDQNDPMQCLCRLSYAELELSNEHGKIIATRRLQNLCGVLSVWEDFELCIFTTETPTKFPAAIQPTFSPNNEFSIAVYDSALKAPRCFIIGSSCSSGHLLKGSGSILGSGLELNAPNTIDYCQGDNATLATSTYLQDESVDLIVVRSIDENLLQVGNDVEVDVSVWSAKDVSKRANPNKWSVAHVYYTSRAETANITWNYIWSEIVEPSQGLHTFTVRFDIKSDITLNENSSPLTLVQAVRVSYAYGQYKPDPCPENHRYIDVDDLVFTVSLLPVASSPTKSPMPSSSCSQQSITWSLSGLAFFCLISAFL